MTTAIDLGTEMIVDLSMVRDPYVRLMMVLIGNAIAPGSPWVAINKAMAERSSIPINPIDTRRWAFKRQNSSALPAVTRACRRRSVRGSPRRPLSDSAATERHL